MIIDHVRDKKFVSPQDNINHRHVGLQDYQCWTSFANHAAAQNVATDRCVETSQRNGGQSNKRWYHKK